MTDRSKQKLDMRFFVKDIERIKKYQSMIKATTAKGAVMQAVERCIVHIPEMAQQYNDLRNEYERIRSDLVQSRVVIREYMSALEGLKAINVYNKKHK